MSYIVNSRAGRALVLPAWMAALVGFWTGLALLVARFG